MNRRIKYGKKKNYRKRNFKKKSLVNSTPNGLKTRPQGMGVGRNVVRIEIPYEFENTQVGTVQNAVVQVGAAISTADEWDKISRNFKYYKMKVINVILPPRPAPTNQDYLNGRMYMDWSDSTIENVTTNDNAKEIPFFSVRTKVYKFIPVNSMLHSYSTNITYNYKEWMPVGLMNANSPGWLKISCEYSFSFKLEIICELRGNETQVTTTVKHVLTGTIDSSSDVKKLEGEKVEDKKEGEEVKQEDEHKDDEEEDVWQRNPNEDRKPRWSKAEKKLMKEIKELQNELNKVKVKEDNNE